MNNQVFFTGYAVLKKLASIGFLLTGIILSCNCFAQSGAGYVSPSGHTLYYKIVPSTNYVLVTYAWNRHSDYPWDGYAKPVGDVVIPTTITMDGATYIVHGVDENAFKSCDSITSVVFSDSIQSIGRNAFQGCIGLQHLTLNVPQISCVFSGLPNLTNVVIGERVTSIPERAFYNCSSLTTVQYNADSIMNCTEAFCRCPNLTSLTFGENVRYIPDYLIGYFVTQIHTITIPRSVIYIGTRALGYNIDTINYYADSVISNQPFALSPAPNNIDDLSVVNIGNHVKRIPAYLFGHGFENLRVITGGDSIVSIGAWAFSNCTGLPTFNFSNTVKVIEENAFSGCSLLDASLGILVDSIGRKAFYGCSSLHDEFVIPESVSFIGDSAFANTNISIFHFKSHNPPYIKNIIEFSHDPYVFRHVTIKVPCGAYDAYYNYYNYDEYGYEYYPYQDHYYSSMEEELDYDYSVEILLEDLERPNCEDCGELCGHVSYEIGCDTTITLYAETNPGYRFVRWSNGCTDNPYTTPLIEQFVTTAYFEPESATQYTITVESNDDMMGTVSGGGTYHEGVEITIVALANEGYRFDHWQDNNRENPRTITVTGNKTYTAYFAEGQNDIDDISNGRIIIHSNDGRIVVEGTTDEVNIYDMTGRSVRNDNLPAGVYMVKVGNLPARKVVVMR